MSEKLKPLIGAAADRPLSRQEAETAFDILFEGEATPSQIGGLLMALRTRGETVEEYAAAAAVMRGWLQHLLLCAEGSAPVAGSAVVARSTRVAGAEVHVRWSVLPTVEAEDQLQPCIVRELHHPFPPVHRQAHIWIGLIH